MTESKTGDIDSAPAKPATERCAGQSMSELVQRDVERMIVTGQIKAGDRISEQSIAENLGVSRGPVREAFRTLTEAGLLIAQRNRGVIVRAIGQDELLDLYEIRAALEGEIAAAALKQMSEDVLSSLDMVLSDMRDAVDRGAPEEYFAANVQFDAILVSTCPNRKLRDVNRQIVRQIQLVRRQKLRQREDMQRSLADHTRLLELLRGGDPDAVRDAFRNHIMKARARIAES